MAQLRVVMTFVVAFALLAVLLVSWAGPSYISWDNTPGSGTAAMCLCSSQALQGAQKMISYQMTGCAVGAALGAILGITVVVLRRKKVVAA
ncbi:MAG: hypothetical protein Q8K32_00115 [Archangium sp.]|nr:hypothetical protein [Archangium sp.]